MNTLGLTVDRIRSLASVDEFEAGQDYHTRGRVRNLVFADGAFKAYVHRIGHYVVRIVPGDGDPETACTCAYRGKGFCRHIVAVALTIVKGTHSAGFHLLNLGDHVQPDALDLAMLQEWGWEESEPLASPEPSEAVLDTLSASDIMSMPVETLDPDANLAEAWRFVTVKKYRHVPVVAEGRLVGIVSDRDLLREAAAHADDRARADVARVAQIMRSQVLTARPGTPIRQVARVMFSEHVGAIPVTDEEDALLGLITRSDILRAVVGQF